MRAQVFDMSGRPWPASDAGRRKSEAEISRKVRRWKARRALERGLWAPVAVVIAGALFALRAVVTDARLTVAMAIAGLVLALGGLGLATWLALRGGDRA